MFRIITLLICFCLATNYSFAQFEFLKEKAKQKIEEKVEEAIEGDENKEPEEKQTENNEKKSEESNKPAKYDLKSYSKYDFVPGDKVIFFEDFEQNELGDFPIGWVGNGTGEIKTTNKFPGKWFQLTTQSMMSAISKDLNLGDNFILELDVIPVHDELEGTDNVGSFYISLFYGEGEFLDDGIYPGIEGVNLNISGNSWDAAAYKEGAGQMRGGQSNKNLIVPGTVNHIIIWVQKSRFRVYYGGSKVLDLPSLIYDGQRFNRFRISNWSNTGLPMIKNIRYTTTTADMRSKLLTEGKLVSHGIYFDVASDKIKPESAGTLSSIAKLLSENPTVNIKIVGHTDSDGKPDANLQLSKKRAESVKNSLVKEYSIDGARIQTDGKGQSEPIDANTTPEGKANNRRVEFIKL